MARDYQSNYPNLASMFLARVQFDTAKAGGANFRDVRPDNNTQVVKGSGSLQPNSKLL